MNVLVYCEITEERQVAEVSLELLSKGRKLADQLGVKLEALLFTDQAKSAINRINDFGVDVIHLAEDKKLFPYQMRPMLR